MRRPRCWFLVLSLLTLFSAVDCSDKYVQGTNASCENGKRDGDESDTDCGGKACAPCQVGLACNDNADCSDGLTCGDSGVCLWTHCTDLAKNSDETDKDCGGSCLPCAAGKSCVENADCDSTLCKAKQCTEASCSDRTKNQGESDIDCGDANGICDGCAAGKACTDGKNCLSGNCSNGQCTAPSCADNVKNGSEGDVDCGGDCPTLCVTGATCSDMRDCVTSVCTKSECQSAACDDTVKNGDETDVDCGGTSCDARCALGKGCRDKSDCEVNSCTAGKCQEPSCSNNTLDGTETAKDCGGASCPPCTEGLACVRDPDCASKRCVEKVCAAPSCTDQVKNGFESDKDCGGICPKDCDPGMGCGANEDCSSGKCSGGKCQKASCTDGVKNDLETDADCGGSVCVAVGRTCLNGRACQADADCKSGVCNAATGRCEAQSCADGRKNQDESAIDCGGICKGCPIDKKCSKNSDCLSLQCDVKGSGLCLAPTCTDGVKNGAEGAVDCGDVCPERCPDGSTCNRNTDCESGVCDGDSPGYCVAPTCSDGVKNGSELDTDCLDEVNCPDQLCQAGQYCKSIENCDVGESTEWLCVYNTCTPPGCGDKIRNGKETDVDCGGSDCGACELGEKCVLDKDCDRLESGHCQAVEGEGYVCVAPECNDDLWNGAETDVDCGGPTCDPCPVSSACEIARDCESGACDNKLCLEPSCSDGLKNGKETAEDCGGAACALEGALCGVGEACLLDRDCDSQTGWCKPASMTCEMRSCTDKVRNGTESDIDCGGVCGASCDIGKNCGVDSDCSSGACSECKGKCMPAPSACLSQGTGCYQCALGEKCSNDFDCASLSCTSGVCAAPDNCIGKLLSGTIGEPCSDIANRDAIPQCLANLRCLFVNNCKVTDPCFTNPDNACGQNKIPGGATPHSAAESTYKAGVTAGICP